MEFFAVLPAAGASTRFGSPKLLVDWRGQPLLGHVIRVLLPRVNRVVAVVRPDLPELARVAEAAGAQACRLPAPTPGMRETVLAGLDWLEQVELPSPQDGLFLLPADSPGITPAVIEELKRAAIANPTTPIFQPTCEGQRGHPVLLRWSLVEQLRRQPAGQGIDSFLRQHAASRQEVAVNEPGILWDVDTGRDLRRALEGNLDF